jgi:hypothetical protein
MADLLYMSLFLLLRFCVPPSSWRCDWVAHSIRGDLLPMVDYYMVAEIDNLSYARGEDLPQRELA